jgi:hypothetical protein
MSTTADPGDNGSTGDGQDRQSSVRYLAVQEANSWSGHTCSARAGVRHARVEFPVAC